MKQQNCQCENCGMFFDSQESLARHQSKFCVNSKYGNIQILNSEFQKLSQGKNISLLGKNVNRSTFEPGASAVKQQQIRAYTNGPESDIDRQYRTLLREIGEREDLKNKLERERRKAEEQLMNLQEKQKEVVVQAKRKDLVDVMKKREELSKEEQTLEKEIKSFERERREEQKNLAQQPNEDFVYREGRQAGKLAMQRRLLQEKKRDLETNLKAKRREQQRVERELGNLNEIPMYIPDYKIKEPAPKQIYSPPPIRKQPSAVVPPRQTTQSYKSTVKPNRNDKLGILQPQSIIKPFVSPPENNFPMSASKRSNVSHISDALEQQQSLLRASRFAGNERTLFQSLNPKGKSDEDIFIQSLVAQEYDALNLLAKIPKDSELYQVKLKQFQEMSRVRQQLKDKVQMVRLQKVRREFELEKQMTETQKANLQWLDQNRKQMLSKGVNILHNKATNEKYGMNKEGSYEPQPFLNPSFKNLPNQFFNNNNNPINNNNNEPTSFNNIPNPIQRSSTRIGMKGYRITVKFVKSYENNAPLSVKLIVFQDGESQPKSIFSTKYHDSYAPKDDRNPYNPGMKNRKDEFGNIAFNESFEIREDLQSTYNSNQNELYLWVMLMEKDEQKLSNEPTVYAWYCFKLTHFGQIREGTFTLNLYHDNFPFPNPTDMNRIKGKAQQEIVIELADINLSDPRPVQKPPQPVQEPRLVQEPSLQKTTLSKKSNVSNQKSLSNQNRGISSSSRRKISMKVKNQYQSEVQNIDEPYFHQNENEAYFTPINSEKTSFNLALVGMRTLPSYIGPLKLQISLMDSSGEIVLAKEEVLSEFEGDMYNPNINYVRKVTNVELPPSTVLFVRITALNVHNYEPGLLGFSYLHLFYNDQGQMLDSDGEKKYFLINGEFQLPIYWGSNEKYLARGVLQSLYPKIPCTSLLISLTSASQKVQFPLYNTGRYNTIFFDVSQVQNQLFAEQNNRQSLNTRDYINAYFKFKGVNSTNEEQVRKLLSQSLAFKGENTANLHNLRNMAEYNPSFGIVFAVDMFNIPTSKINYYYFCSICLAPPAQYYKQGENDLIFLYKIDLATSNTIELVLADDLLSFSPDYNQNTSIIIEILRIEVSQNGTPKSNIEGCSHAIVPLFDVDTQFVCVNAGEHEIRMNTDEFNEKDIKRVLNSLKNYLEEGKGNQKSEFSLKLRIMNGYFPNQYLTPRTGGKGKPLRSIFQNSKGFKNTQQSIRKIIESTYGIKLQ